MTIELPNLKKTRPFSNQLLLSPASSLPALIEKHSATVEKLRIKLGFREDKTVIAWLLEQVEQSEDIGKTIYHLLHD
jgi:hypothetical protein